MEWNGISRQDQHQYRNPLSFYDPENFYLIRHERDSFLKEKMNLTPEVKWPP